MQNLPINDFLRTHNLRIATNPCVSPDFCLDWPTLAAALKADNPSITHFPLSTVATAVGTWQLAANADGDHAWLLSAHPGADTPDLEGDVASLPDGRLAWPATWHNLLRMKDAILRHDPQSTVFPRTDGNLGTSTLGVGARFTTLHWPAVDWTMAQLGIGLTANQNSIPRELVFDVDAMLEDRLDSVPFPFIGTDVPEGHQGQSVEGMSHGCVLAKLKTGFHLHRIPWSFNADHQPIGGKFDSREDALVRGCLLASYITFDLSPELALTCVPDDPAACARFVAEAIDPTLVDTVRQRVATLGLDLDTDAFNALLTRVWPAMRKMQIRDAAYRAIRAQHFSTPEGQAFLRELSIDELPGITTPATTAIMLALCEALHMPVQFVAPAFGFQKNMPFDDATELERLISAQWAVCKQFGVSIGFHSGSGKSAENYRLMGRLTDAHLEIKTSGRYTYEMGVALSQSAQLDDAKLWQDWYAFTLQMAVNSAFATAATQSAMAREFITAAFNTAQRPLPPSVFHSPEACHSALATLPPSPDYMFWFEYNFLFVLAANGQPAPAALGDHSPLGYAQRARFYAISPEAQLRFAKNIAHYLLFLAESTGIAPAEAVRNARTKLAHTDTLEQFIAAIAPPA